MPLEAWLNGQFVAMDAARISAFDAGFQHAVGLFETMRARNGRVVRLMEHLERMQASARELNLTESLRLHPLAEAVESTLARNGLADARVRLTLTAGDMNMLGGPHAQKPHHDPTILIHAQPPTRYPGALFEQGVGVRVADSRLNMLDAFAGHKTLWYWPRLRELQAAAGAGLNEAIWFDVANGLACGCVSNVFVVKDGVVRTPTARGEEAAGALRSPVLPGITRAAVLEFAQAHGYAVDRARLDINALLQADEVFLTNSSWLVMPVVRVEASTIGTGMPGPVAAAMRAALLAEGDAM